MPPSPFPLPPPNPPNPPPPPRPVPPKVLAATSLVGYLVPYASFPTMRALYNAHIDSAAPYAYILLAASIMVLASTLNFALYSQKDKFRKVEKEKEEEEEEAER